MTLRSGDTSPIGSDQTQQVVTTMKVDASKQVERVDQESDFRFNRRTLLKAAAVTGIAGGFLTTAASPVSAASSGGPVVLMGIDAEDGGVGCARSYTGLYRCRQQHPEQCL